MNCAVVLNRCALTYRYLVEVASKDCKLPDAAILTNLNTKIILGNEMATERHAIIESAAQDLAMDERNIASLDRGEAIVSSIFTKFAVPIYIPLFEDLLKKSESEYSDEGQIVFEE